MKKIGILILSICILGLLLPNQAYAASSKVTVSGGSGTVGSQVKMTCTASTTGAAIGSAEISLSYDKTALEPVAQSDGTNAVGGGVYCSGYASGDGKYSISFSVTFKILKVGQHAITIQRAEVTDFDDNVLQLSKSNGTITGKAPTTNNNTNSGNGTSTGNGTGNSTTTQPSKDGNYRLKSLQVHPGTLSPTFNEWTTSYNITVPKDTKEVTISASPQSSKASVTVSGGKDLKLGPNKAQVIVVAENGASVAYTINIMCGEEEKITIHDVEYKINENYKEDAIPTGFSETKVTYKEREYKALVNAKENLYLMSLKNDESTEFFIYDQEKDVFLDFVQIKIAKDKYIIPMALNEEVQGLKDAEKIAVELKEKTFEAWKLDEEFSILYVMNHEGEYTWYRYDSVDETFQRYVDTELVVESVEETDSNKTMFPNEYYMYAVVGLGALCVILLIAMIYFIASRKQRHEGRKKQAQRKIEKQREREEKQRYKEARMAEKQRLEDEREAAKLREIEEKQRLKEAKKAAKKRK